MPVVSAKWPGSRMPLCHKVRKTLLRRASEGSGIAYLLSGGMGLLNEI
jgi:hypothetical protein